MPHGKLVVSFESAVYQEITLDRPEFTLGRAPDNDLVMADSAVSGHHARIINREAIVHIEDLGSPNGTYVNGVRTTSRLLKDLDIIRLGPHLLIFRHPSVGKSPPSE
jgi:pSer/pThr/pTyr-binding forkhead associated (FHA) protein